MFVKRRSTFCNLVKEIAKVIGLIELLLGTEAKIEMDYNIKQNVFNCKGRVKFI